MALFPAGTIPLRNPSYYREWRIHPRLSRLVPVARLRGHGTAVIAIGLGAMGILLVLDLLAWITTLIMKVV